MDKTKVEKHFDEVAKDYDFYKNKNSFYYENLKKLLGQLIPKGSIVFEIGCGTGDLLGSLTPKNGYGYDISGEMVKLANAKYTDVKNLKFSTNWPTNHFDYIFMSDVIEHLVDPVETFRKLIPLMNSKTKYIITMANPIWEPVLMVAEKLGLKMPEGPHNRIKNNELQIMMERTGLKIIKHDYKLLMPIKIPLLTNFVNQYLERPLRRLAFIEYFVVVRS
jgi:SAM-dependent methyltransferase